MRLEEKALDMHTDEVDPANRYPSWGAFWGEESNEDALLVFWNYNPALTPALHLLFLIPQMLVTRAVAVDIIDEADVPKLRAYLAEQWVYLAQAWLPLSRGDALIMQPERNIIRRAMGRGVHVGGRLLPDPPAMRPEAPRCSEFTSTEGPRHPSVGHFSYGGPGASPEDDDGEVG